MTYKRLFVFPLILLFCAFVENASAATIKAASCSSSDVQSAINSAANGDTVQLPSAGGTVQWSSRVSIPNSKGITLDGGNSGGKGCQILGELDLSPGSGSGSRVTNFQFGGGDPGTGGFLELMGSLTTTPWRADHNTFTQLKSHSTMVYIYGNTVGLFDHNTLACPDNCEMIHIMAANATDSSQWNNDLTPGSPLMTYLEDNTFQNNSSSSSFNSCQTTEAAYGARYVERHNTIIFCKIDNHGTPGMIGGRWYEIYENTFNIDRSGGNQSQYMQLRAGSGVVFNNHKTGFANAGGGDIELLEEDTGYPATYQIGRGINQTYSPLYSWGNDASMPVESGSSNVVAGRDFFNSASQPDIMIRSEAKADGGIVNGLLGSSPKTYSYSPFTYPYPLNANGLPAPSGLAQSPAPPPGQAPASPTNLSATVQ
jgi:hypothetical protein